MRVGKLRQGFPNHGRVRHGPHSLSHRLCGLPIEFTCRIFQPDCFVGTAYPAIKLILGDLVQPGFQRSRPLEPGETSPRITKGLLRQIPGSLFATGTRPKETIQAGVVTFYKPQACLAVAIQDLLYEFSVIHKYDPTLFLRLSI